MGWEQYICTELMKHQNLRGSELQRAYFEKAAGRKLRTIDLATSTANTPLIVSQIYTPEVHECETIQRLSEKFRELKKDESN